MFSGLPNVVGVVVDLIVEFPSTGRKRGMKERAAARLRPAIPV